MNFFSMYWYYLLIGVFIAILCFVAFCVLMIVLLRYLWKQRKKLGRFNEIEDIELVLQEQRVANDTSKAHILIKVCYDILISSK